LLSKTHAAPPGRLAGVTVWKTAPSSDHSIRPGDHSIAKTW
jgi:hypothetical protein